jgi:hypothetical protein
VTPNKKRRFAFATTTKSQIVCFFVSRNVLQTIYIESIQYIGFIAEWDSAKTKNGSRYPKKEKKRHREMEYIQCIFTAAG